MLSCLKNNLGYCLFRFVSVFSMMNTFLFCQQLKERKAPESATKALSLPAGWEDRMFGVSLYCLFTPCTM